MATYPLNYSLYIPSTSLRRFVIEKHGYGRKPRTEEPLPYTFEEARYKVSNNVGKCFDSDNLLSCYGYNRLHNFVVSPSSDESYKQAYNKAYSKFVDLLKGDTVELGTALAEGRETIVMVAERMQMLGKAYKALKSGEFRKFLRILRVQPKRPHKDLHWSKSRDASALWLEYWFGWSPTVSTVYDLMRHAEDQTPKFQKIREKGSVGVSGSDVSGVIGNSRACKTSYKGAVHVSIQAEVAVSDPFLFKMNQLGLVNPASVAWEVVPFSFLVDWFASVSTWLNGLTDFVGVTLVNPQHAALMRISGNRNCFDTRFTSKCFHEATFQAVGMRRTTSIPSPYLVLKPMRGLSNARGATAVALVVSLFAKDSGSKTR